MIIAEASPFLEGHKLALSLSRLHSTGGNISVTLIPDSNIYAIMSRVNKVSHIRSYYAIMSRVNKVSHIRSYDKPVYHIT